MTNCFICLRILNWVDGKLAPYTFRIFQKKIMVSSKTTLPSQTSSKTEKTAIVSLESKRLSSESRCITIHLCKAQYYNVVTLWIEYYFLSNICETSVEDLMRKITDFVLRNEIVRHRRISFYKFVYPSMESLRKVIQGLCQTHVMEVGNRGFSLSVCFSPKFIQPCK